MNQNYRWSFGLALFALSRAALATWTIEAPTFVSSTNNFLGSNGYSTAVYGDGAVAEGSSVQVSLLPPGYTNYTRSTLWSARKLGLKYPIRWSPSPGSPIPLFGNVTITTVTSVDGKLSIGTSTNGPLFANWTCNVDTFSDSDTMSGVDANSRNKNLAFPPKVTTFSVPMSPDITHPGTMLGYVTAWSPTFASTAQVVLNGDSEELPTKAGVVLQSLFTVAVSS